MTLGEKTKDIRKRFGLSQEELSEIINVSRQEVTNWETNIEFSDIENLKLLANTFNITVDYLINNDLNLPVLTLRKELDKTKYKNKISSYEEILKEFFSNSDIYILTREKNMNAIERLIDFFVGASATEMIYPMETVDTLSDLSPYYYIEKNNVKLLVNIKSWVLEVITLPQETNKKKFIYGKNIFRNCGKLKPSKID